MSRPFCAMLSAALVVALGFAAKLAAAAEPVVGTHRFEASIDRAAWQKFGLRYPATYLFKVSGVRNDWSVRRADASQPSGRELPRPAAGTLYNGIEAARLDVVAGRLCVSVGFGAQNAFQLHLAGFDRAEFVGMARYYDDRKAAATLSVDNWGCNPWANPGAPWRGETDDASDNYQAAVHVCRALKLPLTVAINSRMAGGETCWQAMQAELEGAGPGPGPGWGWEPAVHGRTHPNNAAAYRKPHGYHAEILGCRDDILARLRNIPYGQFVYEHILTYGYIDDEIQQIGSGEFLLLRGFNWNDNPLSCGFAPYNAQYKFYGVAGLNTVGYDRILERREPKARFCAADAAELNATFDAVHRSGGLFYGLWHPDRFRNSVVYDPRPGVEGRQGSTLMAHLRHIAGRRDVWYAANGWLYAYRYVAEHAKVRSVMEGKR